MGLFACGSVGLCVLRVRVLVCLCVRVFVRRRGRVFACLCVWLFVFRCVFVCMCLGVGMAVRPHAYMSLHGRYQHEQ